MVAGVTSYGCGAYFPSGKTQASYLDLAFVRTTFSGRCRLHSKSVDPPQDFAEQLPRHGDLRHLERDVPGMRDDLGADLHQLLPEARQRLVLDRLREGQGAHEVGKIVGERVKLQTHGVGLE